ncbi:MAG TPA: ABC transporter permease [Pseudonocardiaceae bacterium]|jgi:ABC-2 type transport system permease protein
MVSRIRPSWVVTKGELRAWLRGRSLFYGTVAGIVLLAVYLLIQGLVVNRSDTEKVGLTGQATVLTKTLPAAAGQLGLTVTATTVTDQTTGLDQVHSGNLTALVSGAPGALQVTVKDQLDPRLRAALTGLVQAQALDAQLAEAGLKPSDVQQAIGKAQLAVTQLTQTDPQHAQRLGIALAAAMLLYFSLMLLGNLLARGVVADRRNRVSEVLLAAAKPGQLLLGKLVGLGILGFVQLTVVGLVGLAIAAATGVLTATGVGFGTLGAGLLWYLLGFAFYATLFAGIGALAARLEELQSVLIPIVLTASVGFVVGIDLLVQAPAGAASAVVSVLPPFAPFLMPGRIALGAAAAWQVWLAVLLMLAAIVVVAGYASRTYAAALRTIGRRLSLRDALL